MKINLQELFKKQVEKKEKDSKVELGDMSNSSSTSELYKNRKSYKEQVNNQNLPIGQKNKNGKNLNNQLDMWYQRKDYLKYDDKKRLIVPLISINNLKKIQNQFFLFNFVADAASNFFDQYNVQRNGHPKSILNDIQIVRAYEEIKPRSVYVNEVYVEFFNDVLDPIKNTNKIQTFHDFLNLFYSWFIDKDIPITESGFYESGNYNIYNTGMAFDYIEANTQAEKNKIINDIRFPVLNYVAKVNGLRVDPNNPNRLIADIYSDPMIDQYAKNYFDGVKFELIPETILKEHFEAINMNSFSTSEQVILNFVSDLYSAYSRFTKKYPTYIQFTEGEEFKEKFVSSKIKREKLDLLFVDKFIINFYIKVRAKEKGAKISKKELKYLTNYLFNLLNLVSSKKFIEQVQTVAESKYTSMQALNYLERFF